MIIKKYTGKTEAEATEAAKKELGSGLVIMNVREVKKKGFFAFLSPKQIEITAALEEEKPQKPQYGSITRMTDAQAIYDYLVDKGIIVRNRTRVTLCHNCLRITIGSKTENQELLAALRNIEEI